MPSGSSQNFVSDWSSRSSCPEQTERSVFIFMLNGFCPSAFTFSSQSPSLCTEAVVWSFSSLWLAVVPECVGKDTTLDPLYKTSPVLPCLSAQAKPGSVFFLTLHLQSVNEIWICQQILSTLPALHEFRKI